MSKMINDKVNHSENQDNEVQNKPQITPEYE